MSEKSGGLSSYFNMSSLAFGAAMFFVGGVIDFTFFHNHPLGKAIIDYFNGPLLNLYDGAANLFGLSEYTRNIDFLTSAGTACSIAVDDLGLPIPCR